LEGEVKPTHTHTGRGLGAHFHNPFDTTMLASDAGEWSDHWWVVSCDYVSVCLCVRALKGKRFKLSTPNLAYIQRMAVAQHAMNLRSRVKITRLSEARLAWVCMSLGLL